jgi:hypothetical protein
MPTADQQGDLEGTSTEVEEVVSVLNPSSCVKVVLTLGKFAMDSADGETGLEVVGTARGDTLIQRAVDLNLYPVPTHDVPNQVHDRLEGHYHWAPWGMHEESGEYQ